MGMASFSRGQGELWVWVVLMEQLSPGVGGKRVLLRAAWHPHLGQYRKPPAEEKLSCPELWGHHTPPNVFAAS